MGCMVNANCGSGPCSPMELRDDMRDDMRDVCSWVQVGGFCIGALHGDG